jgi:hypothetical protein
MRRKDSATPSFWRVSPVALFLAFGVPNLFLLMGLAQWSGNYPSEWIRPCLLTMPPFVCALLAWKLTLRRRRRRGVTISLPSEDNLTWAVAAAFGTPLSDTARLFARTKWGYAGSPLAVFDDICLVVAGGLVYVLYTITRKLWQRSQGSPTPSNPAL